MLAFLVEPNLRGSVVLHHHSLIYLFLNSNKQNICCFANQNSVEHYHEKKNQQGLSGFQVTGMIRGFLGVSNFRACLHGVGDPGLVG